MTCTIILEIENEIAPDVLVAAVLAVRRAHHRRLPARPRRARVLRARGAHTCAGWRLLSPRISSHLASCHWRALRSARRARWPRRAWRSSGCATSSASSRTRPTSVRVARDLACRTPICPLYSYICKPAGAGESCQARDYDTKRQRDLLPFDRHAGKFCQLDARLLFRACLLWPLLSILAKRRQRVRAHHLRSLSLSQLKLHTGITLVPRGFEDALYVCAQDHLRPHAVHLEGAHRARHARGSVLPESRGVSSGVPTLILSYKSITACDIPVLLYSYTRTTYA